MKKLLILILAIVSFVAAAQERAVTLPSLTATQTYYKYTGQANDVLIPTTRDTIQYTIYLNKEYPVQYYINLNLAPRAGADTTVVYKLYGKVFAGESWTEIATGTTAAVTTTINSPISSLSATDYLTSTLVFEADSTISGRLSPANAASYYRYLMIDLQLSGNDSVGTGVKVNNIEFKFWRREF